MIRVLALFLFLFHFALEALEKVNLLLVEGRSTYGIEERNRGIIPPPISELIEQARQTALQKLGDKDNYIQVSQWVENAKCEPVYEGSANCIKGSAYLKASFIPKNEFDNDWYVRTSGGCYTSPYHDYTGEARDEALADARFACNGQTVSPPMDVREWPPLYRFDGDNYYAYEATFKCIK